MPCHVEFCQPDPKGIMVVEASDAVPLPQGVMFQPVVPLASSIDPKCFSLLIQNETKKEVTIPRGTPLGKIQAVELASPFIE